MRIKKYKRMMLFGALGFLGFVLFFPWKFESGETCLADHYLSIKSPPNPMTMDFETRIQRYVLPCGILWWMSIGAMMLALSGWRQRRKQNKTVESSQFLGKEVIPMKKDSEKYVEK